MSSPIEKLEEELWGACVIQRAATNQQTIERWQTDESAHLRERFLVQPMPPELNDLVQSALAQWQQIEEKVCSGLGMSREEFLSEFKKSREGFLNRGREWQYAIARMRAGVSNAVRNMDWVNLFSWVLPNSDREHYEEYRAIGRMVTAVFYVELLSRHGHDYESDYLRKIEARWHLVSH
jgi:hypothetical protein